MNGLGCSAEEFEHSREGHGKSDGNFYSRRYRDHSVIFTLEKSLGVF